MSTWTAVNVVILGCNVMVLMTTVKLYTELVKDKLQDRRAGR